MSLEKVSMFRLQVWVREMGLMLHMRRVKQIRLDVTCFPEFIPLFFLLLGFCTTLNTRIDRLYICPEPI